jgi:hypothetical protein
MSLRSQPNLGPLGAAVTPFLARQGSKAPPSRRASRRPQSPSPAPAPESAPAPSVEPVAAIAALLDFSGSMRLAWCLSEPESSPPREPLSDSGSFLARLPEELDLIRKRVERPFAEPFHPRNKLLDAQAARAVLQEADAWSGAESAVRAAAAALFAPLAELVAARIDFVRASMLDLRAELAPELREASTASKRLEELDRVLHEAMRAPVQQLFARLVPAMQETFTRELTEVLAASGNQPLTMEQLSEWYRADGLMARHVRFARQVVLGVLESEADRLTALAQSGRDAVDG